VQKRAVLFLLLFGLCSLALYAKGTLSGTAVDNRAEIHYSLAGIDHNLTSNQNSFLVDRVIDLQIDWQDTAPVEVGAGDNGRVLTFILTNLGNGEDHFILTHEHNSSSDFLPASAQIHSDSNGNGSYDPGTDLLVTDLNLSADANRTLFVVADIPSDANASQQAYEGILAASTSTADTGPDREDQVDVTVRQGSDRDQGVYRVRDYFLLTHKSVLVHSDDNATHTGTVLTYMIDLSIGGHAAGRTIDHVVLRDQIPAGTRYVAGSLRLDGASLSDPVDGDAGSFDGSAIQVDVGTISGAMHRSVTFDVQVQ